MELANLQVDLDAIRRFRERFANFIPPHDPNLIDKLVAEREELSHIGILSNISLEVIGDGVWVLMLKIMLRNLWIEPDQRQKEWGVFGFRYMLYKSEDDSLTSNNLFGILLDPARSFRIPPPTPFEQALTYLVKVGDKARYCPNPECPATYFFVKRKNQRYCSEICAAPAQRELKRRWWAEHGEEWRAARQSKKPSKGRAGKGKSGIRQKRTSKKAQKGSK